MYLSLEGGLECPMANNRTGHPKISTKVRRGYTTMSTEVMPVYIINKLELASGTRQH